MAVKFRVGQQLVSAVDSTAVIIVRAPAEERTLTCGGVEMGTAGEAVTATEPDRSLMGGTQIGKRYVDEAATLRALSPKGGAASRALNGRPLLIQAAKPLPASD